jgi:hypothetical protein
MSADELAWLNAQIDLHAAEFYWQCLHRWGAGPTERQARWIPTVERIIEHRRAVLGSLRP